MTKINALGAIRLLTKAVAEKGTDYVDPGSNDGGQGCKYLILDEGPGEFYPSCIVGHAIFYKYSQDRSFLDEVYGYNEDGLSTWGDRPFNEIFTRFALEVLIQAQREQDQGHTWGKALSEAVDYMGRNQDMIDHPVDDYIGVDAKPLAGVASKA